ncbi:MAG: class I SAM-dependent DNA methyltransferase [Planctomycetes bacterium]|nr:class I SAM-dependent DNA methyltransferase [Planctomycetota bacterium]
MMGRYSLDAPGLIYAHSGNEGFDPSRYPNFPADADGIVPLTDTAWFGDDAANRVVEFIATAWPGDSTTDDTDITDKKEKAATNSSQSVASVSSVVRGSSLLEENLKFVAESLGPKKGESSRDTIRRYLSQGFYKHHLSIYKKRPIYWLFSSGRERAFECLVYLHRYNEGTLSRMRTEYVIRLMGKIAARLEQLEGGPKKDGAIGEKGGGDIDKATSTWHRNKLQKERDKLIKQQVELRTFDEKLRHYADQRISLDLDDGVKVNYGKFGDLLAEVKAVTGQKAE